MNSSTLSSVLEQQIVRLGLKDFPCGPGSWRQREDSAEGVEAEERDALLDLLSCSHSPWKEEEPSWSREAAALRRLAVLSPQPLHDDFIHSYFTTLHVVDKGVSVIDDGVLKFSKLEELVLSANKISEISAENLPRTLKVLELRANCLSGLDGLTRCPPPQLHYLSLGSNNLHSHEDIAHLTGRHWPQLVCLDLSDCEFKDQRALMNALSTLPSLRTLVLQGNPFTLAQCYPGFTVDSLPQLSCLDASWVSPEERQSFRGFAKMSDLVMDQAAVSVSVGRMSGITEPLMSVTISTLDFPDVTYNYFVTYEFLRHQNPNKSECDEAPVTDDTARDADLQSHEDCEKEMLKTDTCDMMVNTEETRRDAAHASRHSTTKLTWSEDMNFSDTQKYVVSDLGALKRFLNQGLHLRIEEEKVVLRPGVSEDDTMVKPCRTVKEVRGGKGKESAIKPGSTKEKSKDKKKTSVPELHTSSTTRVLGSVHVPLQDLVQSGQPVNILCDFGALQSVSEVEATHTCEKAGVHTTSAEMDLGKEIKVKMKEDKESKGRGGGGVRQKNTAASKGKGKGNKECETDVLTDDSVSVQQEPVTVELKVELEKWRSPSEAQRRQPVST